MAIQRAKTANNSFIIAYGTVAAADVPGLFDAGFLGAICISLASSWALGEVFGWAHSLNNKVREAPWFYAFYFVSLITAGAVVLIPKAPLVLITLFVQVVAVVEAAMPEIRPEIGEGALELTFGQVMQAELLKPR